MNYVYTYNISELESPSSANVDIMSEVEYKLYIKKKQLEKYTN